MRKILFLMSLIVIASFALAACGPKPLSHEEVVAIVGNEVGNAVQTAMAPTSTNAPTPTNTFVPTTTPTAIPSPTPQLHVIPLSWFANQGLDYSDGVTVAYKCETGARAWQGPITFTTVPTNANIELVEVNCVQYRPGETIPQSELDKMKGMGTIWFTMPIEGTENQKGDCSCPNGDC